MWEETGGEPAKVHRYVQKRGFSSGG